jgi:hypothetical protein
MTDEQKQPAEAAVVAAAQPDCAREGRVDWRFVRESAGPWFAPVGADVWTMWPAADDSWSTVVAGASPVAVAACCCNWQCTELVVGAFVVTTVAACYGTRDIAAYTFAIAEHAVVVVAVVVAAVAAAVAAEDAEALAGKSWVVSYWTVALPLQVSVILAVAVAVAAAVEP